MSSGAGGDVAIAAAGLAIAAPIVVGAGLAIGAGYCAVGVAKGVAAASRAAERAWQDHEHRQALRAAQLRLDEERYAEYQRAVAAYESACEQARIAPDLGPHRELGGESDVAGLQQATAELAMATARLRRENAAATALAEARALEAALRHAATSAAVGAREQLEQFERELLAGAEATDAATARDSAQRLAAAHTALSAASSQRAQRLRERAAQALAGIPGGISAGDAARVQSWIARLPELDESGLRHAVMDLEALQSTALASAATASRREEQAAAVLAALAGCDTPVAQGLLRRAKAYLAGEADFDPELVSKARAELEVIQRRFDELRAAEVLADALVELGYEVGPDFLTDVSAHDGAFAHRADWSDHAVHVRLQPERVAIQVVREGDPREGSTQAQRQQDIEVEQEFCPDLDKMLDVADERGVEIQLTSRIEPGEAEVDRVIDTGKGRRNASKPREREMRHE